MARFIFAFLGVPIIPLKNGRAVLIRAGTRQRRPRTTHKVLPLVVALSFRFALVETVRRLVVEIFFDGRFDEGFKFFIRFAFRRDTNKLHLLATDATGSRTLKAQPRDKIKIQSKPNKWNHFHLGPVLLYPRPVTRNSGTGLSLNRWLILAQSGIGNSIRIPMKDLVFDG